MIATKTIPLMVPYIALGTIEAVSRTLSTRWVGEGPQVKEFERRFSKQIAGGRPCVATGSCTDALHLAYLLAGIGPGDEVIAPLFTCLGYHSPVSLEDGSKVAIGKIVNKKLPVTVKSMNRQTGAIEPKPVTGWVKLAANSVVWYRLHCTNGPKSRGQGGQRGIWITGDHNVLTRRGMVRVDQIIKSDEVATGQRQLNRCQQQVMDGMLLGDGSISCLGKGYCRFEVSHSEKQKEWFDLEVAALSGIEKRVSRKDAYKGSGPAWTAQTTGSMEWVRLRNKWYPKGKKIVPSDLELTPLSLATWYMDDGSLQDNGGACFCTEGFDRDSCWRLFWKLADFGFRPTLNGDHGKRRLYLGNGDGHDSANRFFELIGRFVLPSMRYKLPEDAPSYDPTIWESLGESEVGYDTAVVERIDPPKWNKLSHVYCLEVEDNHNFLSADIVLSNCTATNIPLLYCGAKIRFCDVAPGSLNIDTSAAAHMVTQKTKAIVVVHYGGMPVKTVNLLSWKPGRFVPVIEDCAQALGMGRRFVGDYACFSFQAVKHVTTGDGGMLVLEEEHKAKAKRMRWFGIDREAKLNGTWDNDIYEVGYKNQMTDIAASMGLCGLNALDAQITFRRALRDAYVSNLTNFDGIQVLDQDPESACWLCTVLVERREDFKRKLLAEGIESDQVHYRNDRYTIFKDFRGEFPNMDAIDGKYLCIPLHMGMDLGDVERICDVIRSGW